MSFATFDVPDTDQVYVSGLADDVTEEDLAAHFGSIGMLKDDKKRGKPKIWLYRDKATNALKGDGTVSYVDPFSATSAVEWFNGKDFKGSIISVSLAESYGGRAPPPSQSRSYNQDRSDGPPPAGRANGIPRGGGGPPGMPPVQMPPPRLAATAPLETGLPGPPPMQAPEAPVEPAQAFYADDSGQEVGQQPNSFPGPPVERGPPPPKELRDGDWLCPGCGNTNFAFRGRCNRCQTGKPGGGHGGGRGRGRGQEDGGRGRGRGPAAAPQGPPGLFTEGDWTCPGCGNTNWARRSTCNMCNGPKPGTVDTNREGLGGGFKELDEAEVEEAKRRRQENEDQSMYDEFGRLKKKFRKGQDRKAREAAALARLRGDPVPGEDEGEKSRSPSPSKEASAKASKKDRSRSRDRDSDRRKDKERDRHSDRDKKRDRSRDRDRDRERDRRQDRSRDRDRDRERDRRR